MLTTVTLDDELLSKAQQLSGISERTLLIRESLKAFVQRERASRLAPWPVPSPGSMPSHAAGANRFDPGRYVDLDRLPAWHQQGADHSPRSRSGRHPSLGDRGAGCGTLENRQTVLSLLGTMPTVVMADHQDMLTLIDTHQPIGRGIDYVDAT